MDWQRSAGQCGQWARAARESVSVPCSPAHDRAAPRAPKWSPMRLSALARPADPPTHLARGRQMGPSGPSGRRVRASAKELRPPGARAAGAADWPPEVTSIRAHIWRARIWVTRAVVACRPTRWLRNIRPTYLDALSARGQPSAGASRRRPECAGAGLARRRLRNLGAKSITSAPA